MSKGKYNDNATFDKKDDRWTTAQYKIQCVDRNIKHLWNLDPLNNPIPNFDPDTVLIGASIIDSLTIIPTAKSAFNEHIDIAKVVNFGSIGDEIGNVIWRLEDGSLLEIFGRSFDPKLIILLIGENDIHKAPIESMIKGMKRIINRIRTDCPNAKIVVIGLPPQFNNSSVLSVDEQNDKIRKFNTKLSYLDGISDYYYCWDNMYDGCKIDNSYITNDVYLTLKGNIVLIQKIADIIHDHIGDVTNIRQKATDQHMVKKIITKEKASYDDDDY